VTLNRLYAPGAAVGVVIFAIAVALYMGVLDNREVSQEANNHVQRGIQLYQQGALPEAEFVLKETLMAFPKEWKAAYYLGVVKTLSKEFDQAIPYLEKAYALHPMESKIPNALGVAYFKLGKLDLAKGYFAASLDLDRSNTDTKALFDAMARLQRRARLAENSKID